MPACSCYLWLADAAYAQGQLDSPVARPMPNCVLTTTLVKISPAWNRIVSRGPGGEERLSQRRSSQEKASAVRRLWDGCGRCEAASAEKQLPPACPLAEAAPRGGSNPWSFHSPAYSEEKPGNDSEQGRGTAGACGVEREFGLRRPRVLNSRGGVGAWATGVLVGWWAGPARFPWTLH